MMNKMSQRYVGMKKIELKKFYKNVAEVLTNVAVVIKSSW